MARYYFHVQNQVSFVKDDVGIELDTFERVREQMSDAAGEILTSDLRAGKTDITFQIQVEDGSDRRLITLDVSGAIAPAAGSH